MFWFHRSFLYDYNMFLFVEFWFSGSFSFLSFFSPPFFLGGGGRGWGPAYRLISPHPLSLQFLCKKTPVNSLIILFFFTYLSTLLHHNRCISNQPLFPLIVPQIWCILVLFYIVQGQRG